MKDFVINVISKKNEITLELTSTCKINEYTSFSFRIFKSRKDER